MSIHTRIVARITSLPALIDLLNQQQLEWGEATVSNRRQGAAANAVWCRIGQETLYVCQWEVGKPFQFLWDKPSTSRLVRALADVASQRGRSRAEPTRGVAVTYQPLPVGPAPRSQDDTERQRRADENLRLAAEERTAAKERVRAEKEQRRNQLQQEASELVARLDARNGPPAGADSNTEGSLVSTRPDPDEPSTQELEGFLGRLHQLDALRKIKDGLSMIEDRFGARLESEITLEDETVELKLML